MHDVGKIAIPDAILLKPGPLTRGRAPRDGATRRSARDPGRLGSELLELAATIAWTHHERFDGRGYPRGLAGEEIPLEGRIAAVADVFDALTTDRVYRAALPVDEAVVMMQRSARSTSTRSSSIPSWTRSTTSRRSVAKRTPHTWSAA